MGNISKSTGQGWRQRFALPLHYSIILIAGLPGAMGTVITSVYLVTVAGLDPFVVACYANGSTILGMLVTYYAGRGRIDRRNPVVVAVVSMLLSVAGVLLLLPINWSIWLLVPSATLRGAGNLLMPSLFMFDERYRPPTPDANAGMYYTRLVISVVWILGPPLAFYLFWLGAFPAVAAASSVMALLASAAIVIMAARLPVNQTEDKPKVAGQPSVVARPVMSVTTVFSIMVCVTAANVLHSMAMPLYLLQELAAPQYWPGFNMALAAGTEVICIAAIPQLLKRTDEPVILRVGLALGLVYFVALFFVHDPRLILAMQVVYGAHFAFSTVVCLGMLKAASQQKIGSVAAQFLNAGKLGGLAGAAVFGLFATRLGFGGVLTDFGLGLVVVAMVMATVWRGRVTAAI